MFYVKIPHKYQGGLVNHVTFSNFDQEVVGNSDRYDNGIPPFRAQSYQSDKNVDIGHNMGRNRLNMTWAID